jgi:hypothetical protein
MKPHRVTTYREISLWERFLEWLIPARRRRRYLRNRVEELRVAQPGDEERWL